MDEIAHGEVAGAPRSIGGGMTSVVVETSAGPRLSVELGVGALDEALLARERAARATPELLTSTAAGRSRARAVEASAYRGDLVRGETREVALFPIVRAATLAPALARARAGERTPLVEVIALAVAVARGLAASGAGALLTPTSILIADGRVLVRGPLLETIVSVIRSESDAPRWTSYFAPEQIQGAAPTAEARRFALALVLVELATGRAVFPAGAAAVGAIAGWQPTTSVLDGIEREPGASELRAVLWSWLQRDPRRRLEPERAASTLAPFAGTGVAPTLGASPVDAPYFLP